MCTSAGWAETFIAISNTDDCNEGNEDLGYAGDCGNFATASAYILLYLVLSFLIIVNMYIAVILENYTQVPTLQTNTSCNTTFVIHKFQNYRLQKMCPKE